MLNEEDKKQIAKLVTDQIKKDNPTLGMSKTEREEFYKAEERENRKAYLKLLKEAKRDTLAQAIEGMKLAFEDSSFGKKIEGIKNATKPITSATSNIGKAIASSKLSQDFVKTLMYSNPVTALIAQNTDLIKGVGKAGLELGKGIGGLAFKGASGLYSMLRGKPKNSLVDKNGLFQSSDSSAKKILDNKSNEPKYINVQNAVFTGGKNYILNAGGFIAAKTQEENQLALPQKTGVGGIFKNNKMIGGISKGVEGISAAMKTVNTVLSAIKMKQVLIAGLIMLGVAGVIVAINKLREALPGFLKKQDDKRQNLNNSGAAATSGQWAGKLPSYMSQVDGMYKMGKFIEKHPDALGEAGKSTTTTYKKGDKIADKIDASYGYDVEKYNKTTFEATDKGFLVTCPFDQAVVSHVRSVTRDKTIFYEVTISDTGRGNDGGEMIFHYLSQSRVYKNQHITKSYPIGVSSKYFYISSRGKKHQEAAKNFESFTNEQAKNNYNDARYIMANLSEKEEEKIRKQSEKLGDQYYNKADDLIVTDGGDQEVNRRTNAYPTTNVNTANKNVTNAVQNVDQGKSIPETEQKPKTTEQKDNLLSINTTPPSSSVIKNFQKSASNTLNSGLIGNEITV